MKKLAIIALSAVVATVSLSSFADARSRDRGDEWRRNHSDNRGWRGDRGRNHNWHRHGWRHNGWRGGWRPGYWGGPRIIIAPGYNDYCFIKKVKRYDAYGNAYIKRVRVCR
ncbi:MAG: hypothetical protein JWM58_2188 [Rhizobium sp.]|nr:hypothetical protein [Rhizobium sp.]